MKDHSNKDLLKAIDSFRHGGADIGSIEWDTLMFYFEDACREYALEKFYDMWLDDDQTQEAVDSPRGYEFYVDYLLMYLCD